MKTKITKKHVLWFGVIVIVIIGINFVVGLGNPYLVNGFSNTPWYDQEKQINDLAIKNKDVSICDKISSNWYIDGGTKGLIERCKGAYFSAYPNAK